MLVPVDIAWTIYLFLLGLLLLLPVHYYGSKSRFWNKQVAADLFDMFERIIFVSDWPVRLRRTFLLLFFIAVPIWIVIAAFVACLLVFIWIVAFIVDEVSRFWSEKES